MQTGNLKSEAIAAINKFLNDNPDCDKLFGNAIRKAAQKAKYINPLGNDKLLDKSLYQLGVRRTDPEDIKQDKEDTLRDEVTVGEAITIGNTVYLGSYVVNRRGGSYLSETNRLTYVHEILHVLYRNDDAPHTSLSVKLGIRSQREYDSLLKGRFASKAYPRATLEGFAGENDIDGFLKSGCNPDFKPDK